MKNTFRTMAALFILLAVLLAGCALAEEVPTPSPTPTPLPTVAPEDLNALQFVITGPDGNEVATITYEEFTEGKYRLENLVPGTYTVSEVDPDRLLEEKGYKFDEENSVTTLTFEVLPNETATDTLVNIYERPADPTPTPTPEPTETPVPDGHEKISIPVTKVWDDMNNRDGNRPERVFVHLLANGKRVAQAALTAAGGWTCEFTEMPNYSGGNEIEYTVEEDPVALYTAQIDGFTITNSYVPETTSATVSKVWADNNNAAGLRPISIYCMLSNGISVLLSDENGWTATVDNLPTTVNGQPVTYSWTEQEAVGYEQTGKDVSGNNAVFTNTVIERGKEEPPEGKKKPPKTRGDNYLIIEDYGTPLGVEVVINHVGDCFD